jgi:hypothetical protein
MGAKNTIGCTYQSPDPDKRLQTVGDVVGHGEALRADGPIARETTRKEVLVIICSSHQEAWIGGWKRYIRHRVETYCGIVSESRAVLVSISRQRQCFKENKKERRK